MTYQRSRVKVEVIHFNLLLLSIKPRKGTKWKQFTVDIKGCLDIGFYIDFLVGFWFVGWLNNKNKSILVDGLKAIPVSFFVVFWLIDPFFQLNLPNISINNILCQLA